MMCDIVWNIVPSHPWLRYSIVSAQPYNISRVFPSCMLLPLMTVFKSTLSGLGIKPLAALTMQGPKGRKVSKDFPGGKESHDVVSNKCAARSNIWNMRT